MCVCVREQLLKVEPTLVYVDVDAQQFLEMRDNLLQQVVLVLGSAYGDY